MRREKRKRPTREGWSTEAECRGGVACSSEEGSVTGLELRRNIVQLYRKVNRKREEPFWTKQSRGAFRSDGFGMLINVTGWGTACSTGGGLAMPRGPGRRGQFGDALNRSISQAGQHVAEIIADWDLESAAAFDCR